MKSGLVYGFLSCFLSGFLYVAKDVEVVPDTVKPTMVIKAICYDGSVSYSNHRRGTCSHHGGVKQWMEIGIGI